MEDRKAVRATCKSQLGRKCPGLAWLTLLARPPELDTHSLPSPETTFRNPWGLADLVLFLERLHFVSAATVGVAAAGGGSHSSVIAWSLLSRTGLS